MPTDTPTMLVWPLHLAMGDTDKIEMMQYRLFFTKYHLYQYNNHTHFNLNVQGIGYRCLKNFRLVF